MHYLSWIELLSFYFSVLGVGERPAVVVREKRVLEANPLARSAGVDRGMSQSEAKAILENGVFHKFDPEPFREAQRSWLMLLAEVSDVIEPIEPHIALCDFSQLPNPEDLIAKLRSQLAEKGLSPRIGCGSSRWIAELAARNGESAVQSTATFLGARPVSDLIAVPEVIRHRLRFLGCKTISDVAMMPRETLREQFGEEGLVIWSLANGGGDAFVSPLFPPESISQRLPFEGAIKDREALFQAVRQLSIQLGELLLARDRMGSKMEVWLEHEEGEPTRRSRTFARRMQSPGSLLPCLALMVQEVPDRPMTAIRVRLSDLKPALRVQRTLEGRSAPEMRDVAVQRAVREVRLTFGDQSVKTASELPVERRIRVLRAWKDATGWV